MKPANQFLFLKEIRGSHRDDEKCNANNGIHTQCSSSLKFQMNKYKKGQILGCQSAIAPSLFDDSRVQYTAESFILLLINNNNYFLYQFRISCRFFQHLLFLLGLAKKKQTKHFPSRYINVLIDFIVGLNTFKKWILRSLRNEGGSQPWTK